MPTVGERACTTCGHPARHHDAGECWTTPDGTETWGETSCLCARLELAEDEGGAS